VKERERDKGERERVNRGREGGRARRGSGVGRVGLYKKKKKD